MNLKRTIIITLLLAVFAAAGTATPAIAVIKSCSASSAGGEKTPVIDNTAGTVSESGTQGYKCTVAWDADVQPQYEAGGTWHYCTECAPGFHPNTPGQFWPANCAFNWPHIPGTTCGVLSAAEADDSWAPSASADTPVCKVNWRIQVNFFDSTHFVFQSDVSPELHKTC